MLDSVDYVRHPVKKPELCNPNQYVKPAGLMEDLTCYRKEYSSKSRLCPFENCTCISTARR